MAKDNKGEPPLPPSIRPETDAPVVETKSGTFDLDNPVLPDWIADTALSAGGYPYDKRLKKSDYEDDLEDLQVELVKLQKHVAETGLRLLLLFEGRDAAGKGSTIFNFKRYLPPRKVRTVALPAPTDVERGQWYFQRYVAHLPTSGEMVLFDRSWYNRAGVEPVMGFCTPDEHKAFLEAVPDFERMLVDQNIRLFKFWLNIGRATQLKRFFDRRHDPLKVWKLSPMDYAAMKKWDDYTRARNKMMEASHRDETPWTVVRSNDKRRARLSVIRHVLDSVDYPGKDKGVVQKVDTAILGGPELL